MKKTITTLMASGVLFSVIGGTAAFADEASKVNATVSAGTFALTTPNDVYFTATLNGAAQTITLPTKIETTVADYRGVDEGWNVTVKSSNYDTYKGNFVLSVGGNDVTSIATTIDTVDTRTQKKALDLETKAMISETAVVGSFEASLEWTLAPNAVETLAE